MKIVQLTSAQRCLIAGIVDRAIDVTAAGEWVAASEYNGSANALDARWYRPGGRQTDTDAVYLSVCLSRREHEDTDAHQARVNGELIAILNRLGELLTDNQEEKPS